MTEKGRKRVFVAMSGGVDSSVAALLLTQGGYDVVGVFMRCWSGDGSDASVGVNCTAEKDAEDARRVAGHLGIPFYVWDFEEEYKRRVVDYMIEGYRQGVTPNPDVMCNKEIKFGLFLEKALRMGADYIATGHYVRLQRKLQTPNYNFQTEPESLEIGNWKLEIARDAQKDQSYFLWTLTQKQLRHCLFPIGDYLKSEVREIARKAGLPTAEKKDSQGICFLGKVTLADFLRQYIPEKRGMVLNSAGAKIGEHNGAHFYTIGQRHLGVNIQHPTSNLKQPGQDYRYDRDPKPLYVAEKNVVENTLVVAEGNDNPALYRKEISLMNVNFINPRHSQVLKNIRIRVLARVRYRQRLARAVLLFSNSRELENSAGSAKLIFEKPQKFVAAGQSAVFYVPSVTLAGEDEGDPSTSSGRSSQELRMLGGGIIV